MEKQYNEHDIVLAEKLGGLTSSIQNLDGKFCKFMDKHDDEHHVMWTKIDKHTKLINRGIGIVSILSIFMGIWYDTIKKKLGF